MRVAIVTFDGFNELDSFIALGLLTMADEVVGALLQDAWPAIRESRIAWLRGPLHQT